MHPFYIGVAGTRQVSHLATRETKILGANPAFTVQPAGGQAAKDLGPGAGQLAGSRSDGFVCGHRLPRAGAHAQKGSLGGCLESRDTGACREGRRQPQEDASFGELGGKVGAPPNRDPHRPWRRNLRFLRPKMRTLEKISTRLPLHSPRFLLGLLRLLLADGRSQCCSRACRFWRIKPLAMAAAMVAKTVGSG